MGQSRGTIVDHCQSRSTIVGHVGQSRGNATIMDVTILRLPHMQVNHQLISLEEEEMGILMKREE